MNMILDSANTTFGKYQEEAIISLALDHPDFFTAIGRFMTPDLFTRMECKYVIAEILNYFEKHNTIVTRGLLRDSIIRKLTVDDPYEPILSIIDRKSNHREVPAIKETLLNWARNKAFGLVYSDEAITAYHRGDYNHIENIVQQANRLADIGKKGFWFFENIDTLFKPNIITHLTTGFPKLDLLLNNGGPSPKEVLAWLAPTNVGKSLIMCNNCITSLCGNNKDGTCGQDVLFITFELDTIKTAMRCLGVIGRDIAINDMLAHEPYIRRLTDHLQNTYNKRILIQEWAPDECSVDHIYALLDNLLRTESWKPDVIIIDYLDLMVSRVRAYNDDDYTRQKHVATEIRGLAKNTETLVFTATQTNRSATTTDAPVDLNKAAESFGKQFALDYVISINQNDMDRKAIPPRLGLFVAKNRNGPKFQMIDCEVNYDTMYVKEL